MKKPRAISATRIPTPARRVSLSPNARPAVWLASLRLVVGHLAGRGCVDGGAASPAAGAGRVRRGEDDVLVAAIGDTPASVVTVPSAAVDAAASVLVPASPADEALAVAPLDEEPDELEPLEVLPDVDEPEDDEPDEEEPDDEEELPPPELVEEEPPPDELFVDPDLVEPLLVVVLPEPLLAV